MRGNGEVSQSLKILCATHGYMALLSALSVLRHGHGEKRHDGQPSFCENDAVVVVVVFPRTVTQSKAVDPYIGCLDAHRARWGPSTRYARWFVSKGCPKFSRGVSVLSRAWHFCQLEAPCFVGLRFWRPFWSGCGGCHGFSSFSLSPVRCRGRWLEGHMF